MDQAVARKREITRADIMPMPDYAAVRVSKRQALLPSKRLRRVPVGPDATFYFESFDTMWLQIHEMLHIEKGGEDQIADELHAYNPLIPQGDELVATLMFEIDDPARRARVLGSLGGVEETLVLEVGGEAVQGESERDVDRTTADGKASSVQFVHFHLKPAQIAAFKTPGTAVTVGIRHPSYGHMALLSDAVRAELAKDLD